MRIAQISDCHLYAAIGTLHYGVDPDEGLERTLAAVADWNPDLLVASGDLAEQGSAPAYARLAEHFDAFSCPVLVIPGNHDDEAVMRDTLASDHVQIGGQLTSHGVRVLTLDTKVAGANHGRLSREQLALLDQALTTDIPTLIVMHHHPVPVGSPWIDTQGLANPEELFERIADTDCVEAITWGHIHQVFEAEFGHLKLLSAPSTSTQAIPRQPSFVEDDPGPGFRWFEFAPDKPLVTGVVRVAKHGAAIGTAAQAVAL